MSLLDTRTPIVHPSYAGPATRSPRTVAARPGFGMLVFGVLLPAAVIVIECVSRMCAGTFFDPLPTPGHLALALSVPLGNAAVWAVLRRSSPGVAAPRPRSLVLGMANGFVIAAASYYTLLFLPLIPFAVIAIILYGLGLLPLAPLLGLIAALRLRQQVAEPSPDVNVARTPGLWRGFALGGVAVVALVAPAVLTQYGLGRAASTDPVVSESGVRFLRRLGSESHLLAACYARPSEFGLWDGFDRPGRLDTEFARRTYYRVTGRPYESVPSPFAARGGLFENLPDFRDRDEALRGGETVGTVLSGLSAASSEIQGRMNGDAATAYFEWTLVFQNDQPFAQEARTHVALPRGGCVSRLTLWVNGEEREAAWGARGKVRAAYEEVVKVQRRDPVLVTGAGPDRVLMQCYPVPAHGTMQVRVGVTAPLALRSETTGEVDLPRPLDRNFAVRDQSPHAVRIVSAAAVSSDVVPSDASGGLWGHVTDRQLCSRVKVAVQRDAAARLTWFDDTFDRRGGTVVQRIEACPEQAPALLVLAIDGSAPMQPAVAAVADALDSLPLGTAVTALVGSDSSAREFTAAPGRAVEVAEKLREFECVGGQDGVPLLTRAMAVAGANDGAVVVWVHGPQPVILSPTERLANAVHGRPRLVELQVIHGRNVVADALAEVARVEPLDAGADPLAALGGLFESWSRGKQSFRAVRTRQPDRPPEGEGRRGDLQMVRLWAQDEVTNLLASPDAAGRDAATALAVSHQIVTPVSGAVVLETQAQYTAAGLAPAAAVPLPPAVWMALLTLPLMWWAARRFKRAAT